MFFLIITITAIFIVSPFLTEGTKEPDDNIYQPPINPPNDSELEENELQLPMLNKTYYTGNSSSLIMIGAVNMKYKSSIKFKFHASRFGRLTAFDIFINDMLLNHDVDDLRDNGILILTIDKDFINSGNNLIRIEIKSNSRGGGGYPSFQDFPLTLYSDSMVISDALEWVELKVVDH